MGSIFTPDRNLILPPPRKIWEALPGSQSLFLQSPIREVCFAGTRGPGKTDAMLFAFNQYCGRGYGDYWRGIIFRRNYKHLDDIINKSKRWFNRSAQKPRFLAGSSHLKWVWPTGEELLFRAFEEENDYWSYHGHEYCVEIGTLVKTPKGYVPIETLKIGDEVCTPAGIDHVTRTFSPKIKDCVISAFYNESGDLISQQVQSEEHRLLTNDQKPYALLSEKFRTSKQHCESTLSWQSYKSLRDARLKIREGDVCQTDGKSLSKDVLLKHLKSELLLESKDLETFYVLQGLFLQLNKFYQHQSIECHFLCKSGEQGLNLLVAQLAEYLDRLQHLLPFGLIQDHSFLRGRSFDVEYLTSKVQDFQSYYYSLCDLYDVQFPNLLNTAQDGIPLQDDAVIRTRSGLLVDDRDNALEYNLDYQGKTFRNFYDLESAIPLQKINFVDTVLYPCYPRLTVDITIGTNKVYITDGGVVNSNCFIGWEELTSWPSIACYESMKSTNRSSFTPYGNVPMIPRIIRSSTNPYGVGHNWVKQYFIDPAPYGQIITDHDGNQRVALFGSIKENPHLGEDYVKTLQSITDPNKRKAWLEGSWDITSGGMFDDLWDSTKHVLKPFKIPSSWKIDRSFDWGSSKPFSVGWWAQSDGTEATLPNGEKRHFPRGTLFRFAEWYGCEGKPNEGLRMTAKNVAIGIRSREAKMGITNRVQGGPADSAIYAVTDDASIGQNMESEGVFWTPADKRPGSRKNGWELMRDRLAAVVDEKLAEKPGFYVFDSCRDFIRTVPHIPRDDKDQDDVDTDAEDHAADDARYRVLASDYTVAKVKIKGI